MPLEDASYLRETGEGLALRKVAQMTRISLTFGGPWLKGPLRERPGSSSQSSVPSHVVALESLPRGLQPGPHYLGVLRIILHLWAPHDPGDLNLRGPILGEHPLNTISIVITEHFPRFHSAFNTHSFNTLLLNVFLLCTVFGWETE